MAELSVLPTLAVVPFTYVGSGNAQLDVVGEILANNVINLLSQSLHLKVVSRLSTTRFRKANWSFAEVKQKLGCDFLLHGVYSEAKNTLSIEFRLCNVATTNSIWEDEIHCAVRDILDSNSYPVSYLANSTAEKMFEVGLSGYNVDSLDSLEDYALYINAIKSLHASNSECFLNSKNCFVEILKRHPANSDISASLALWHALRMHRKGGWNLRDQDSVIRVIQTHIDKAIELNPENYYAITLKALIETQLFKNVNGGLELLEKGMRSSNSDPRIYATGSLIYLAACRTDEAVACIDAAIELSPLDPQLEHFYTVAAGAHYQAGRLALAAQFAERSIEINSIHTSPVRTLIAIQMASDEPGLAKITARRLMKLEPEFTVESWLKHWSGSAQCGQQFAAHLSAAGIPLR